VVFRGGSSAAPPNEETSERDGGEKMKQANLLLSKRKRTHWKREKAP